MGARVDVRAAVDVKGWDVSRGMHLLAGGMGLALCLPLGLACARATPARQQLRRLPTVAIGLCAVGGRRRRVAEGGFGPGCLKDLGAGGTTPFGVGWLLAGGGRGTRCGRTMPRVEGALGTEGAGVEFSGGGAAVRLTDLLEVVKCLGGVVRA